MVGEEGLALRGHQRRLLRVDLGEHPLRPGRGHVHAELPEPPGERVGVGRDLVEELLLDAERPDEVHPHPFDRVLELPQLQLAREAVAGGVVGRGVRVHPVGEGLDEHGPVAGAALLERPAADGEAGEHVVAVDADAGEAVALRALVQRHAGLPLGGLGDGPLVVLAVEDDGRVVHRRPDEALVHVALAGGAVAEEAHGGLGVGAVAHLGLELLAHRVAGGVEALVADDDRVEVEAGGPGIPAALVGAPEDPEQLGGVDPAAPRHAVLAVGRERHVLGGERAPGPDLRGFLAQQRHPDAQLALALQGVGLAVEAAHEHHVAVEALQLGDADVGGVGVEPLVAHPLALGREQLHEIGAALVGGVQRGHHVLGRGHGLRSPGLGYGHGRTSCAQRAPWLVAVGPVTAVRSARSGRPRTALCASWHARRRARPDRGGSTGARTVYTGHGARAGRCPPPTSPSARRR